MRGKAELVARTAQKRMQNLA